MPESLRRPLLRAFFISLALHGTLLLSIAHTLPMRLETPAARLNALLSSPVTLRSLVKPAQNSLLKPTRPLQQPAPKGPEKAIARALVVQQAPQETRQEARPVAEQAVVQATEPEVRQKAIAEKLTRLDDEPQHSALAKSSLVSPNVASLTNSGVSADDLRQYRLSLAIAARRFKRYPAVAREPLTR